MVDEAKSSGAGSSGENPSGANFANQPPLLEVKNLKVRYGVKNRGWKKNWLTAVDDISFHIRKGQTMALVGESGSGKTSAALAIAKLAPVCGGQVKLEGADFLSLKGERLRRARAQIQFIFQDPYSSLNPRKRAESIVAEPLRSLHNLGRARCNETVDELFGAVGLRSEQKRLFPHQFSGGQRQRIGIARALASKPDLIICDEPVSALDLAVQAQILNLLRRLQERLGLTYLLISHDLGVVRHMCDWIAVMYMGKIVEYGARMPMFNRPLHPYTLALLSAVPKLERKTPRAQAPSAKEPLLVAGEPPDPLNPPKGCRFASRCPIAQKICRETEPPLRLIGGNREGADNRRVACHLVDESAARPPA